MNIFCPSILGSHMHISICSKGVKNHNKSKTYGICLYSSYSLFAYTYTITTYKKTRGIEIYEKEENQEMFYCFLLKYLTLNMVYKKWYRSIYNSRK